jgi:hypothetical protein
MTDLIPTNYRKAWPGSIACSNGYRNVLSYISYDRDIGILICPYINSSTVPLISTRYYRTVYPCIAALCKCLTNLSGRIRGVLFSVFAIAHSPVAPVRNCSINMRISLLRQTVTPMQSHQLRLSSAHSPALLLFSASRTDRRSAMCVFVKYMVASFCAMHDF